MCVCCRCVYVCVCVCVHVSRHKTLLAHTHTHACTGNHYYFIIFIIFLTLSNFNIDLVGPPRDLSLVPVICLFIYLLTITWKEDVLHHSWYHLDFYAFPHLR